MDKEGPWESEECRRDAGYKYEGDKDRGEGGVGKESMGGWRESGKEVKRNINRRQK